MLALPLALAGCGRHATPDSAGTPAGPAVAVSAVDIVPAGGESSLLLGGRLKADDEVTIAARVAGRLSALPVADGAPVRRGAAVALFSAPEAEAARAAARSAATAARVRRDVARRQAARMDTLLAAGVVTRRERELADDEREAAESAWSAAEAANAQAAQSLSVEAPFDGVIVRHLVDPGASVMPGQPLLTMRSASAREVVVAIPDGAVPHAAQARWAVQDRAGAWHEAHLARLDGASDPATRSRLAYLTPSNVGDTQPGDFMRVRLDAAGTIAAPHVPSTAIVTRGELTGVFVLRDGRAWLRWVRVGHGEGDAVLVLSGLAAGDRVARDARGLTDGVRVTLAR